MVRPIVVVSLAMLLPTLVQGQGRGATSAVPQAMSVVPHAMAAAPSPVAHTARPIAAQPVAGLRVPVKSGPERSRTRPTPIPRSAGRSGGSRRHSDNDDHAISSACSSSVPGLGFDVPHLAAVCGAGAVGAGRDRQQSPFFFPFFDSGFVVPDAPAVPEEAAADEAQPSEEIQAEVPERSRRVKASREEPAPVAQTQPDIAPIHETDEYIFVRRDGTVFFAVAYAWENGTLRYITSEGLRHNIAKSVLDLDATQQFNEQRGLNFRLPT